MGGESSPRTVRTTIRTGGFKQGSDMICFVFQRDYGCHEVTNDFLSTDGPKSLSTAEEPGQATVSTFPPKEFRAGS